MQVKPLKIAAMTLALMTPALSAQAERYAFITHAVDGDEWWQTMRNAADLAAQQMGVEVQHFNPTNGSLDEMAAILNAVADGGFAGVVTTLPDAQKLSESVVGIQENGSDVIVVNSGTVAQADALGAVMYVGQPDYDAAFAAGQRARADGVDSFLCVNDRPEVPAARERCLGFADGLGLDLAGRELRLSDASDAASIAQRLADDGEAEAVFTLGATAAQSALQALANMPADRTIYHATFDLDEVVVQAIQDGRTAFAIDQQQFLQGYMPIVVFANLHRYGVLPANDIDSGPGFVTRETLGLIASHAGTLR
ncbi:substrate-binding domain-containing protein [Pontivivens insulae]|uniref:Periplasmic binding protein domain-containing protein n=1 Tax=Pontivivens insulae TaxID=1639689 RepID=A0A2R8AAW8_9RHOB|nr:substrate-binding domain-containing protein [Pontivivens insulae]RED13292.1 simple sugar transport system substrate-binding protein [Pontivivens insulae]SPF29384.1 hypothetical protein POI8812_01692 [Pontivivens insulae]